MAEKILRIGYHVSIAQSIDLAFDRALELGCTAMQIFTSNPRGWAIRPLSGTETRKFVEKSRSLKISPVVSHMPYLPNLASSNKEAYEKSVLSLKKNIERCNLLKIKYLVAHLGSHLGKGKEKGLENIIAALNSVDSGRVKILLENTAGHQNSVGSSLEELAEIFDASGRKAGFCLDTCHLFAYGYDIREHEVLDQIDEALDFRNVELLHLNDARQDLGSHLDRHENIGKGRIGVEGFRRMFSYKGLSEKPMILETPMGYEGFERDELALVRSIISS